MKTNSSDNWQAFKLKQTTTERISKWIPWIILAIILLLLVAFFGVGTYYGMLFSDEITFFLSSVIALFAFVEGLTNSLKATRENNKNRLNAVRDELENVYAPLYSIFSSKWTYTHEKVIIVINQSDKDRIDTIIRSYPFLIKQMILKIWRKEIERLKPYKSQPSPVFMIPAYFVSHITIEYYQLTDEYQKRTGMEMVDESSFWQNIHRYPPDETEKTLSEIIAFEQSHER